MFDMQRYPVCCERSKVIQKEGFMNKLLIQFLILTFN